MINHIRPNKFMLAAMALTVATPAMVVQMDTVNAETKVNQTVAQAKYAKIFKDVSKNNAYYNIIHEMTQQGIISGYEDGTFKPSESVSRKHASALIIRAIERLPKIAIFKAPKDLSIHNPYYNDIKKMMEAGVLAVDSKGNINPNKMLTRGEMAKILAVAYDLETSGTNPLTDVSKGNAKYVSALYNNGITTGFDDKTFKENASLTRAHYAVFMYRAQNYKEANTITLEDISKMSQEEIDKLTYKQIVSLLEPQKYGLAGEKVPLPEGYTDRAAATKNAKAVYALFHGRQGLDANSSTPTFSDIGAANSLRNIAKHIQKPFADIISMVNKITIEGDAITSTENDPVKFAMYFNYEEDRFYISFRTY